MSYGIWQAASPTSRRTYIYPRMVTILATYKCTAACKHCCFDSNPQLKERLSLEQILSFIDEAAEYDSIEAVVFSGGECFLLGDDLVTAVRHVTDKGLVARCVTNGYWAKSITSGRRTLGKLHEVGLTELNVSTGDFHQQFVSQNTVINAAVLGIEFGMTTVVVIERQLQRGVTAESFAKDVRIQTLISECPVDRFKIIESPWMPMDLITELEQDSHCALNSSNVHLRKGCDSILTTVVLNPQRRVGICCGLTRERIPELTVDLGDAGLSDVLKSTGSDFMKIWLFVEGPEKILAWAATKHSEIRWENRYAHKCHACLALFDDPLVRSAIQTHYRERLDDVLLRYSVLLRQQERLEAVTYG